MFIKSQKIKGVRINIFEHEYLRKLFTLPPVLKNDSKPKGVNNKYKYLVIWYSIINKENYQKYCVK